MTRAPSHGPVEPAAPRPPVGLRQSRKWYRRYGLNVLSDVPFGSPLRPPAGGKPDLDITLRGCSELGGREMTGRVLAERWAPSGRHVYTVVRRESGYLLRIHGQADFQISEDLSTVSCSEDPDAPRVTTALLLQATVLAFVMALRGHFVLHASAVAMADDVFALAGPSGSGKSTTAALMCAGGAALVADDLICVKEHRYVLGTGPGASLRLRQSAKSVLDLFPVRAPVSETIDGRLALELQCAPDEPVPLAGVLFPAPATGQSRCLRAERLHGIVAVTQLVASARVAGWRDEAQKKRFSTELPS
jgi:hypothetical protein